MDKRRIAAMFEEIAVLLELKGESPFKSRAYANAAHAIESLTEDVAELVTSGRIKQVDGIGQALAEKLAELVGTGRLQYYEELKSAVPAGLVEMTAISGMGPKKIQAVWEKLGVTTIGELEYACIENRLVGLPGFGEKTQEKIKQGILQLKKRRGFHLLATVIGDAHALIKSISQANGVRQAELAGDVRRCVEIVRTIDILVGADRSEMVKDALIAAGCTNLAWQDNRMTATSSTGIPTSVRILPVITPHARLAASGSESHLGLLAARAAQMRVEWHLSLDGGGPAMPQAATEEALYARLGLPFIEPEMREGLDEIALAEQGRLGPLVEERDIQGVFHNHTTASDGSASLEEMIKAAKTLGYRYIGISDHSQSAFYANGLKEDRIRDQHASIQALRSTLSGITVLKGIECDILPDGTMDYPDDVLARFDFVIGSVHSRFNLPEEEQTRRVVRALANPHVTMLGHPTGRLLLSREGYRIDMKQVIDTARQHNKIIEINANPHRLDLDWRLCRYARSQGVKVSINPDAHATEGLEDVPFGVQVARKGGLTAADVINTLGPDDILPALTRRSPAA
jgi:DNA polymerase (family 10)